ncbi:hypothetical protein DPB93_25795 [Salmonella enterica subsp. salamae]|nr:hypothetical protein [Salmonella enterica subsp. salamae]
MNNATALARRASFRMRRVYLPQVRVERSETTEPLAATARRVSESRANGPALLVVETLQTQFMAENPGKTKYCTTPSLSFSTDIKGVICGRSYPSSFGLRSSESKTRRYRV